MGLRVKVRGVFVRGGKRPGGFLSGGKCPGGFCPGGGCPDTGDTRHRMQMEPKMRSKQVLFSMLLKSLVLLIQYTLLTKEIPHNLEKNAN